MSEKEMTPHSSTLAWKIPWMEEPGELQSMGSLRVRHDWVTSLSLFPFMHWRRKWQYTPVFLPGESQGWGSLLGCCLWGCSESDMTEGPRSSSSHEMYGSKSIPQSINNFYNDSGMCVLSELEVTRIQLSSVAQSFLTLCDSMECSTPGFLVLHQLLEFAQTHVHWVSDAIQPSHPLSSPSPPDFNLSQNQSLFKRVSSSHQMAKALEFQLQHQSFQWIFRTDFL